MREFVNYLKYIELSSENIHFYLWFQDYAKRFNRLPDNEKALSPPWQPVVNDLSIKGPDLSRQNDDFLADVKLQSDLGLQQNYVEKVDPLHTPSSTAKASKECISSNGNIIDCVHKQDVRELEEGFSDMTIKLRPCEHSSQYFRNSR